MLAPSVILNLLVGTIIKGKEKEVKFFSIVYPVLLSISKVLPFQYTMQKIVEVVIFFFSY